MHVMMDRGVHAAIYARASFRCQQLFLKREKFYCGDSKPTVSLCHHQESLIISPTDYDSIDCLDRRNLQS